jgi:hypothetical protein
VTSKEERQKVLSEIKVKPEAAIARTLGGLAGGYLVGRVVSKIRRVTGKEKPVTGKLVVEKVPEEVVESPATLMPKGKYRDVPFEAKIAPPKVGSKLWWARQRAEAVLRRKRLASVILKPQLLEKRLREVYKFVPIYKPGLEVPLSALIGITRAIATPKVEPISKIQYKTMQKQIERLGIRTRVRTEIREKIIVEKEQKIRVLTFPISLPISLPDIAQDTRARIRTRAIQEQEITQKQKVDVKTQQIQIQRLSHVDPVLKKKKVKLEEKLPPLGITTKMWGEERIYGVPTVKELKRKGLL